MVTETIAAVLISFVISAVLLPILIPLLKRLKLGQQVREEGPEAHLKKQGTPTMGGIAFIIAVIITSLIFARAYPKILPVLFVTVGFGIIGFIDDFIKIAMKHSEGLNPIQKLIGQFIITAVFTWYLMSRTDASTSILIPFTGGIANGIMIDLGILYIPFVFIVVLGTDNGVNFTDGLDGLCSSVTIVVAAFLAVVSIRDNGGTGPIAGAVIGGLMGFLMFNAYPAKVFMGDTGSLALGGFAASCALMMDIPLFIPIFGLIYLVEILSVVIQVTYFKISGGKRIFKMTPIHHHFELCGWSETRIVAVFTVITVILCLVAYLGL